MDKICLLTITAYAAELMYDKPIRVIGPADTTRLYYHKFGSDYVPTVFDNDGLPAGLFL